MYENFHHENQRKLVRCIQCLNIKNNIFLRSVIVGTEFNNSAYFRGPPHMLMWTDFLNLFFRPEEIQKI